MKNGKERECPYTRYSSLGALRENGASGLLGNKIHEKRKSAHRRFIADLFESLEAPPLVRVDGPWWVEVAARKKGDRLLIQLVNRSAAGYLAPNRHVVEQVPDAGTFTVVVPTAERPKRVYLAPDEAGLEWTWSDGLLTAKVGGLQIHNVLVVE